MILALFVTLHTNYEQKHKKVLKIIIYFLTNIKSIKQYVHFRQSVMPSIGLN